MNDSTRREVYSSSGETALPVPRNASFFLAEQNVKNIRLLSIGLACGNDLICWRADQNISAQCRERAEPVCQIGKALLLEAAGPAWSNWLKPQLFKDLFVTDEARCSLSSLGMQYPP